MPFIEAMAEVPYDIARCLLYNRGLFNEKTVSRFINASILDLSPPMETSGMNLAVERINAAIASGERVGVFGDFDVDGLTGAAILTKTIRTLGGQVSPYIPHRDQDGHGLSLRGIDAFRKAGVELIVTVDTGTNAVEEVKAARTAGIEVIITDHHLPDIELPEAYAIVNPGLNPENVEAMPAGAGVALKTAQALFESADRPIDTWAVELAALGTIADSMPLIGENRCIVKSGLKSLETTSCLGLRALLRNSTRSQGEEIDSETVAYRIAPRLNAPGRLGDAEPSLQLLITEDENEAAVLADRIEVLNTERRALSREIEEVARADIRGQENLSVFTIRCDGFPSGLLGPTASKLAEEYMKPAVAFTEKEGIIRASVRSIPEFNIYEALSSSAPLLLKFGGHSQAAGFSTNAGNFEKVIDILETAAAWHALSRMTEKMIQIEVVASLSTFDHPMWCFWEKLKPFGNGNNDPVFAVKNVCIENVRTVGKGDHLRLTLEQNGYKLDAIGFGLGRSLLSANQFDIAFNLRNNVWRNRKSRELGLIDIRPSEV